MLRSVGVPPASLGKRHGEPLGDHQLRHRVERGQPHGRPRLGDVLGDRRVRRAEDPDEGSLVREADRSVAVLHRRVRLAVDLRRLTELERGLLGDADAPSVTQEHEVVEPIRLGRRLDLECHLRVGDRLGQVGAEGRAQQRERRGREPRLDDRSLVGEVQDDHAARQRCGRRRAVGRDHDRDGPRARTLEQLKHLRGRPAAGDRDHHVVPTLERELRRREGIGLPLTGRLAEAGVGARDEERRAAPHGRHARPGGREDVGDRSGERRGPFPARRLARDLARDFAHFGGLYDRTDHSATALLYFPPCIRRSVSG